MAPRSASVGALRRVMVFLRAPPARSRRAPRALASSGQARRTRRESRRRSAVIGEDKHPREAARGFCRRCMATHRLERDAAAEAEARALMARIRAAGRLDFDREVPDPRFGVETMYEPGGGKMLGVLLAERAETSPGSTRNSTLDATREAERATSTKASNATKTKEIVVLKAFSGQMRGEWHVPGWAPPLCALTHDAPRYAEAHEKSPPPPPPARARRGGRGDGGAALGRARTVGRADPRGGGDGQGGQARGGARGGAPSAPKRPKRPKRADVRARRSRRRGGSLSRRSSRRRVAPASAKWRVSARRARPRRPRSSRRSPRLEKTRAGSATRTDR